MFTSQSICGRKNKDIEVPAEYKELNWNLKLSRGSVSPKGQQIFRKVDRRNRDSSWEVCNIVGTPCGAWNRQIRDSATKVVVAYINKKLVTFYGLRSILESRKRIVFGYIQSSHRLREFSRKSISVTCNQLCGGVDPSSEREAVSSEQTSKSLHVSSLLTSLNGISLVLVICLYFFPIHGSLRKIF